MTKVKYFQTIPGIVQAMQFGGKNAKDVADWVLGYALHYDLEVKNGGSYVNITDLVTGLEWRATKGDWVVHSVDDEYFYVESAHIMKSDYVRV